MPVIDHPTHDSVIQKAGAKYGCFNNVNRQDLYMAKNGYFNNGTLRFIAVKDNLSKECRYDMALRDACCSGCERINRRVCV